MNANELKNKVNEAFSDVVRPEHFTDHTHCEECADHDETLQSFNPDTIGLDELGNPGWDPMCFVLPDAFRYYFPAMVRLALNSDGIDMYLSQFLFHMSYEGESSRFFHHFTKKQREVTLAVLEYIQRNMTEEIESWNLKEELEETIALWSKLVAEI